jgi:hypothetical protein
VATMHRARAVLKVNRRKTVSVTGRANAMCSGIGGNPSLFLTPNPPVSAVEDQIVVVGKAEVVAATRAKGAAAARNVQRNVLVGMLEAWQTFVQGIADSVPADQAMSTIEAAGLAVALVAQRTKAILAVTQGPEPGTVALNAYAAALTGRSQKKTFFNWQSTADGGRTFVSMPPTPKSKTTLANLTPLTTYGFRVSVTGSDGVAGPWSQVVSFLVH